MKTLSNITVSDARQINNLDDAIAIFDQLEPIDTDFMLGHWRGEGIHTGHSMDGMLELVNWHGKHFVSTEEVYPLVHVTEEGQKFIVQPALIPTFLMRNFPSIKNFVNKRLFLFMRFLFTTHRSSARLRMTEFRGKASATMIYDTKPINDIFRKIDDNTVLGAMDFKGEALFFFMLVREQV